MRDEIGQYGQRGFTLLEVLVAVLVVSIGALGLAAMGLQGMRSTSLSYQRTLATAAAQDGVERLWAELWADNSTCPAPADVTGAWYAAWNGILEGMESSGSTIEADALAPCRYTITVSWSDDRFAGETDAARLVYRAQLPGGVAP